MVSDHQLFRIDVIGNHAITQVTEFIGNIKGFLITQVNSAGSYDADCGPGEFAFKRSEGNTLSRDGHSNFACGLLTVRTKMPDALFSIWHLSSSHSFRKTSNNSSLSGWSEMSWISL